MVARSAHSPARNADQLGRWPLALILVGAVIAFYRPALTTAAGHIQWDAVDVHLSAQRYFSEHLRAGLLPFWTPYIFAGFPFLADPQVGAWYPPNWPFMAWGITPRVLQLELPLHALLASAGAFQLAVALSCNRTAALVAGFAYGFSGFFVGHSSHLGMFQSAAWLPWLLLALVRSFDEAGHTALVAGGVVGGMMILAGHFQTTLYTFSAAGLLAIAECTRTPQRAPTLASRFLLLTAIAIAISAVQTLPGLELVENSVRAGADYSQSGEGSLPLDALPTLWSPNHLGALDGRYQGPADRTQYYFYAGLLTGPLALWGLCAGPPRLRRIAVWLIVPGAWYACGPSAGLYRLVGVLPGFRSTRAPIHIWFIVGLAIALLAAAGLTQLTERLRWRGLAAAVALTVLLDLLYWNGASNRLIYSDKSFENTYGASETQFREAVAATQPPLTRLFAPQSPPFGPLNHPLDLRLEATYGYNPLALKRYARYLRAATDNQELLAGLNVSRWFKVERSQLASVQGFLPRASFPPEIRTIAAADDPQYLRQLDPAAQAIVETVIPNLRQDASATATIVDHGEQGYRIAYRAGSTSILLVSLAYFPGWRATVDGQVCDIVPVDHALLGIVVPPGDRTVDLAFRSNYFGLGALISIAALGITSALLLSSGPRHGWLPSWNAGSRAASRSASH